MKIEEYKNKLENEKKLLEEELSAIGKIVNKKIEDWKASPESETNTQEVQDEGDLAERSEDYEERASQLDVLEERLKSINKSLKKISENKFGICEKCGAQIEEERLKVNPAASTCEKCM